MYNLDNLKKKTPLEKLAFIGDNVKKLLPLSAFVYSVLKERVDKGEELLDPDIEWIENMINAIEVRNEE